MHGIRLLVPGLALLCVVACRPPEAPGKVYGERPSLTDTTAVAAILANPETYVGRRVLVTGPVVDVCEKRGCWLALGSDREQETLRVKVEDGVIVFPVSARGHRAVVEGVVEKLVLTEVQAREQAKMHAAEKGVPFDSTAVLGPTTSYQIKGLGAIIAE
jgi:hypothetical protein